MEIADQKSLRGSLYKKHRNKLNINILQIAFIYLSLSIGWNLLFHLFHLPYSRADLRYLLLCLAVWIVITTVNRFAKVPPTVMKHVVLCYVLFIIINLYFGSGYREAWCFFLVVPLCAGLYGSLPALFVYSFLGLAAMVGLELKAPLVRNIFDSIDLSNRILVYVIIATFGHLLYKQLSSLYFSLVSTISKSADDSIEQIVKTFIVAIEAKDSYTFGHSERVSEYAVELARKLPEYENRPRKLHDLRMTGLLHDIGKINIPEHILGKTSKLTDEEYELIKTHTVVGAMMVEKISGLGSFREGVLYHHERWDGKGYPTSIRGEDIPLAARILAIADAFDAMTSNRAYRQALSPSEAFERLLAGKGSQFDPRLIEVLNQHQASWIKLYKQYSDELKEFETVLGLM